MEILDIYVGFMTITSSEYSIHQKASLRQIELLRKLSIVQIAASTYK